MMPYVVNAALITTGCFLFYRLLLHRETFFRLNRWFFLCCLLLSFLLPLLPVPDGWSLMIRASPVSPAGAKQAATSSAYSPAGDRIAPVDTRPSAAKSAVPGEVHSLPVNSAAPMNVHSLSAIVPARANPMPPANGRSSNLSGFAPQSRAVFSTVTLFKWLRYAYFSGILFFGCNMLLQLMALLARVRSYPSRKDGLFHIVEMSGNWAPCSFGPYIFINPALYDEETFLQILAHEKVHVQQGHSLDILLAELFRAVQWFNPFAWWYRKALENNLEFLTDEAVIRNPDTDVSRYQMSLLRVSAPYLPLSITSNYNQSLLKKRIMMIHAQKSPLRAAWKYLLLLPLLAGMICVFNDTRAAGPGAKAVLRRTAGAGTGSSGDTSAPGSRPAAEYRSVISRVASAGTDTTPVPVTDSAVSPDTARARSGPAAAAESSARSMRGSVPLTAVAFSSAGHENVPVGAFGPDLREYRSGVWMATLKGDNVELILKSEDAQAAAGHSFRKSEFSRIPTGHKGDFTVTRGAGTVYLTGVFDGNDGFGHFTFRENSRFAGLLEKEGVTDVHTEEMSRAFFADIREEYIRSLVGEGYTHLRFSDLVALADSRVDRDYIESWKEQGYTDLPPYLLHALKTSKVDIAYLKELQAAGYGKPDLNDLLSAKNHKIDTAYIRYWKEAGYSNLRLIDLSFLKASGIDKAYVQYWKDLGYTDLTAGNLMMLKDLGIGADYVRELRDAGMDHVSINDLIGLHQSKVDGPYINHVREWIHQTPRVGDLTMFKTFHVDSAYIRSFGDVGYPKLEANDLRDIWMFRITPDFIKGFAGIGYKDVPLRTMGQLKIAGVTPDFVQSMKGKGYNFKDLSEYIRLREASR